MAKSPRKQGFSNKQRSHTPNLKKGSKIPQGGKSIKAYKKHYHHAKRRFSIADSTSSLNSSETGLEQDEDSTYYNAKDSAVLSDFDSSLTMVSDDEDEENYPNSHDFLQTTIPNRRNQKRKTIRGAAKLSKKNLNLKGGNKYNIRARKGMPKKTTDLKEWESSLDESDDLDVEEELDSTEMSSQGGFLTFPGNYAIENTSNSDSDSESQSGDDDLNEHDYSSSDDSDVDFVKLQAERKAKSMKALRAIKGLPEGEDPKKYPVVEKASRDSKNGKVSKLRSNSSISKNQFRRRSEVPFPKDINFSLNFDGSNEIAIDESDNEIHEFQKSVEGEDMGEEVSTSIPESTKKQKPYGRSNSVFDFDSNLHLDIAKIRDEDIYSDEDYDIDDNELLATLQADNDLEQFSTNNFQLQSRNNSVTSFNDDDENDPFLKEEEKFLVNEFENNGFDDSELPSSEKKGLETNTLSNGTIVASKNTDEEETGDALLSSTDSQEDEDDDYDDFIDFNVPLFDKEELEIQNSFAYNSTHAKDKLEPLSDEDDSYLWNYFFSSDNESSKSDADGYNKYYSEDELEANLFKGIRKPTKISKAEERYIPLMHFADNDGLEDAISSENEYDSSESTDVDTSLPESSGNKFGSKVAKEVLSSKTADYRPPILGTWVTIDSQPFGIIDGLSTRTLDSSNSLQNAEPRLELGRKGMHISHSNASDDLAIGLDELLNMSELDDNNENDIKIWRDFNRQKKRVPLGAFRNKSILNNSPPLATNATLQSTINDDESNSRTLSRKKRYKSHQQAARRRASFKRHQARKFSKKLPDTTQKASKPFDFSSLLTSNVLPKSKRRRASLAEALSAGLRPTKSGLFSEDALADAEEILGDDVDLMSLISGI